MRLRDSICEGCWYLIFGDKPKIRMRNIHTERCSWCLDIHRSGIYLVYMDEVTWPTEL